ncbi:MAG: right-handed parallel beta-helix repeat-containing protein [Candidatus Magnetobacterium sp. LHC-1]
MAVRTFTGATGDKSINLASIEQLIIDLDAIFTQLNSTLPSTQFVSVIDYGADETGATDSTTAIQNAINAAGTGSILLFPAGSYSCGALTGVSNIEIWGWGATIVPNIETLGPIFTFTSKSNVKIIGLNIVGTGDWTSTPFAHPDGGGNAVGFENKTVGYYFSGCTNFEIYGCKIYGIGQGIKTVSGTNINIHDNIIDCIGENGIYAYADTELIINHNYISNIKGNITSAGDVNTDNSKFADGILSISQNNCIISNNIVHDCVRIGIVIDWDTVTQAKNVEVVSNIVHNTTGHRGTEANSCIWVESGATEESILITGNHCYDSDQSGIVATNGSIVSGNFVYSNTTFGIVAVDCTIKNNEIYNNANGISASGAVGQNLKIIGNTLKGNTSSGINIDALRGVCIIRDNDIEDNGSGAADYHCGIWISDGHADQKIIIDSNTFLSSASEGDTTGQLYAIRWGASGYTTNYIWSNKFFYTGTFSSPYPTLLDVAPTELGNDTGAIVFCYGLGFWNENKNSKIPETNMLMHISKRMRFRGYSTIGSPPSIPHRIGDFYYSDDIDAAEYIGMVCTVAGTPGTFKGFGLIQS